MFMLNYKIAIYKESEIGQQYLISVVEWSYTTQ